MVQLDNFDASQVEPNSGFDPLPAGWYEAVIIDSQQKTTKAGTGSYVELQLEITSGEYRNRILFDLLNLNNPSDKAVEIARATLSSICRAVGVLNPRDTSELHFKPLLVQVGIRKSEEYGDKNEVKRYKGVDGQEAISAKSPGRATAKLPLDDNPF
jgi:hypothetical protein